jgi:hypothetical protein
MSASSMSKRRRMRGLSVGSMTILLDEQRGIAAASRVRSATTSPEPKVSTVRPDDHRWPPWLSASKCQPRARQSTTPCSMRWALKPFLRRISTASTAMTQYGPRQ